MQHSYRWRSRPNIAQLEHEIDTLKTVVIRLRRELENKQDANGRLKLLLRERLARIDELTAKIEQLRAANQKLDAEADHLAKMVAAAP
jgi:chromosome segregation ATPase